MSALGEKLMRASAAVVGRSGLSAQCRLADSREMGTLEYLHLQPGDTPPRLDGVSPFKAVLIVEADVAPEWQKQVSDWLVRAGCRYMMAWGKNASGWEDIVDRASLEMIDYEDIADDDARFVLTTHHNEESLQDTFWYCGHVATHPRLDLEGTYLMDIAAESRAAELLSSFREANEQAV